MRGGRSSRSYQPVVQPLEMRTVFNATARSAPVLLVRDLVAHNSTISPRSALNGLVPLTDLGPGMTYKGYDGGLYGQGSNQPPTALLNAALGAAAAVQPLNRSGARSPHGRIGVIAIGQSTTRQWFPYFQRLARQLPSRFVLVNAGQDGKVTQSWAYSSGPWVQASRMVASSGLTRFQVQVAIVDLLRIYPWKDGGLQAQIKAYRADLTRIVAKAKASYPNLRLVYVLPFHYAGYTDGRVTREPYGYQEGFGVRQLIEKQGRVSPVLLWGPYVWADMANPAYYYDGIHFTTPGRSQMASLMWSFWKQDPVAQKWLWGS